MIGTKGKQEFLRGCKGKLSHENGSEYYKQMGKVWKNISIKAEKTDKIQHLHRKNINMLEIQIYHSIIMLLKDP